MLRIPGAAGTTVVTPTGPRAPASVHQDVAPCLILNSYRTKPDHTAPLLRGPTAVPQRSLVPKPGSLPVLHALSALSLTQPYFRLFHTSLVSVSAPHSAFIPPR